jgi:hypothetical protein
MLTRWALLTLFVCLLSNLNFVLAYCSLALALHIAVPPIDLLAFVPLVTVATALPISLGGWGVREGLLVLLLGKVGVPASEALILSLMYGFCSAASGLPGLLGWWFSDD